MDSLEFFLKSIISELIVAVPSLILGAFNKPVGMVLGLVITGVGLFLTIRGYEEDQIGFFEFGIPAIIAAVFVELTLNGIDATWVVVIGVLYSCIWLITEMIVSALESVFR